MHWADLMWPQHWAGYKLNWCPLPLKVKWCHINVLFVATILYAWQCHRAIVSPCNSVTMRQCYHATVLPCDSITMQQCCHATVLPCRFLEQQVNSFMQNALSGHWFVSVSRTVRRKRKHLLRTWTSAFPRKTKIIIMTVGFFVSVFFCLYISHSLLLWVTW